VVRIIENPSLRQVAVAIPILGLFSVLNIARMYCFLWMSAIVAYLLERIEPSPLDLEQRPHFFRAKGHVAILLLACLSRGT
jgi:hypothetical protein